MEPDESRGKSDAGTIRDRTFGYAVSPFNNPFGVKMADFAVPRFSKKQVRRAGEVLAAWPEHGTHAEYSDALEVINNFRQIHAWPLNTFQTTLRTKGRTVDPNVIVAQRVKRLSSIRAKLDRFPTLNLSQMQDIGGCRAILSDVGDVTKLVNDGYLGGNLKHILHTNDDYILNPKPSGYRGRHLIYVYYSDKVETYNGLKIEMQFRSQYQHAWATAVEVVGTFTRQALKSSQGEGDWLRFFQLMSSAIAKMEDCPAVPTTPARDEDLVAELREVENSVDAVRRLRTFSIAPEEVEFADVKNAKYYLLELNVDTGELDIQAFTGREIEKASDQYLEAEKKVTRETDAVLVSVESIAALRKAYPNYYADTDTFVYLVEQALEGTFYA